MNIPQPKGNVLVMHEGEGAAIDIFFIQDCREAAGVWEEVEQECKKFGHIPFGFYECDNKHIAVIVSPIYNTNDVFEYLKEYVSKFN